MQYYSLAADVLAENERVAYKLLSPVRYMYACTSVTVHSFLQYLYDFMDANITQQSSQEEVRMCLYYIPAH